MTPMAEAFGADVRLVAFMQYLRVVLVRVVASIVSRIWVTPGAGHAAAGTGWLPAIQWLPFAETLALAGAGAFIARRTGASDFGPLDDRQSSRRT